MVRRGVWILGGLALVLVALVLGRQFVWDEDGPTAPARTSAEPSVLNVSLDPGGRPYDVPLPRGTTVVQRPLTVLHAPSRELLLMGGEYLPNPDLATPVTRVRLAERPGRRYPVRAVWTRTTRWQDIVGIVIVERDAPIVRWRELHRAAYVTDGGTGGITTPEWAARPESERLAHQEELTSWYDRRRLWSAFDVDGHEGVDTIAFANGYGDGGFPSLAGYDASGTRAAIVLWTAIVPWRVAFPEGKPPLRITAWEDALAACLEGRRTIEGASCRPIR